MVADGKNIEKVGKCHKVKLQMQEYNLESDFFAVALRANIANTGYLLH